MKKNRTSIHADMSDDDDIDLMSDATVQIKLDAKIDDHFYMTAPVHVNITQVSKYCKKYKFCHELLMGPTKPYFDVENYFDTEEEFKARRFSLLKSASREICQAFPKANVMDFDSSGYSIPKKQWKQSSRHIVVNGGYYAQGSDIVAIAQSFKTPGFDLGCYKDAGKEQNVRIPYAVKLTDPSRQLVRALIEDQKVTLLTEAECIVLEENMETWMLSNVENEVLRKPKKVLEKAPAKQQNQKHNPDAGELERVVMGLSDKRAESYQGSSKEGQWLEVLMVLKNSETYPDEFLHLAHQFSMKCPEKYSEGKVDEKYAELGKGTMTVASLYMWLKADNKTLFNAIQEEKKLEKRRGDAKVIDAEMGKVRAHSGRQWTAFDFKHFVAQMEDKSEVDFAELIEYINDTTIYVFNGGNAFWHTKNYDAKKGYTFTQVQVGSPFSGKRNFDLSFQSGGKMIHTTMDEILEQTKLKRAKSEFVFEPYFLQSTTHSDKVNKFTGFPHQVGELTMSEPVSFILNHLHILCGEEELSTTYVKTWIATFIQQPQRKLPFLVSIAKQGSGRGTFFDEIFAQRLIGGKKYCKTITDMDQIVGKFNAAVKDTLFSLISESANNCASVSNNETFKSLTMDVQCMIQEKGVDPYPYDNYGKYALLSNHSNPVVISPDDRRTVVIEATNNHIQDPAEKKAYFDKLHKYKDDPEVMQNLFTYFATLPIDGWDDTDRPITEAYRRMQSVQLPSSLAHIQHICSNEQVDLTMDHEDGFVTRIELYSNYKKFCIDTGVKPSPQKYYDEELLAIGVDARVTAVARKTWKGARKSGISLVVKDIEKAFQKHLKRPTFKFPEYIPLDEE